MILRRVLWQGLAAALIAAPLVFPSTGVLAQGKTPISQPSSSYATSLVATASSADVTTDQKAALIAVMNTLSALGIWPAQA